MESLLKLKEKLQNGEIKRYGTCAIFEMDVKPYDILFDNELEQVDDSQKLMINIEKMVERILRGECWFYDDIKSINIMLIPNLYYDLTNVKSNDKRGAMIDIPEIKCHEKIVNMSVGFIVERNDGSFPLNDLSLNGNVDYNNFYKIFTENGYQLECINIKELINKIFEKGQNDCVYSMETKIKIKENVNQK